MTAKLSAISLSVKVSKLLYYKVRRLSRSNSSKTIISIFAATSYHIAVETGDCRNAGTDANVFVCLWGSNGDTGRRPLKYAASDARHRNKFERGHIDKFTFESADIGDVKFHFYF